MANDQFKTLQNALSAALDIQSPGSDTDASFYLKEAKIISLVLSKVRNGEEIKFEVSPWRSTVINRSPLSSIEFSESLYNTFIFGSLVIFDDRNWVDEFLFNGDEKVDIQFKIGSSEEIIKLKFHIYDARSISDESYILSSTSADERVSVWKLEFISSEVFLANYNKSVLEIEEDFIGALSGTLPGISGSNSQTQTEEQQGTTASIGLIETVFKKFNFKTNIIDSCKTGVWLKYNYAAYPWMKQKGQSRLAQFLRYVANYAWDGNTKNYVADYHVWEDRNGWNFRSVSKMLLNSENNTEFSPGNFQELVDPIDGFIITINKLNKNRILNFQVVSEYNIQGLFENGALATLYTRTDPNYDEVYMDFVDSRESFKQKIISYDYSKYRNDIVQIEKYPLIPQGVTGLEGKTLSDYKTINYSAFLDDEIYGYFNKNYLNTPYYANWDEYGRTLGGPWNSTAYQPQFDMTNLSVLDLKNIQLNIRNVLEAKRAEYARKKNIKRKWEVYRCTVCCHEFGALGSTADIALLSQQGLTGTTYDLLFGPNGVYANRDNPYEIVAAGSFTDTLNYQAGNTFYERGLTYSYDLSKSPYNETLGQFFNLTGPTAPDAYTKYVIQRAVNQYDIIINKLEERILDLTDFVESRVQGYKNTADSIFKSFQMQTIGDEQRPLVAPDPRPIDLLLGVNNRFLGDAVIGEQLTDWPITSYEFGMVPHSKVGVNTGVKQVVFTDESELQQKSITFRNLDGGSSTGGVVRACIEFNCNFCTGICYLFSGVDAECPGIIVENCDEATQIAILEANCSNCGPGIDPPGPLDPVCIKCNPDGTKECIDAPPTGCPQGTQPAPRYVCESLPPNWCDNQGSSRVICAACVDGRIECYGDALCEPGSIVSPEICCPQGGTPVVTPLSSEALCNSNFPCFGGPQGPTGPQGPQGPTGPTGPTGPSNLPTSKDVAYINKCSYSPCSNDKVVRGYIKHTTKNSVANYSQIYVYAAPYLWDTELSDWSFYDYGSESGLIPGIVNQEIKATTQECLQTCGCYNTTCASSVALEVLRRTCVAEIQLLSVEIELVRQLKQSIVESYEELWKRSYAEWFNRNAFFFSKKPGTSIFRNQTKDTVQSPLSLQNIKSITRKEVRGSRYELLSRKVGVTGASAGQWLYQIFFAGNSGSTFHPYYDQKYGSNSFVTSRKPHVWFGSIDGDATDDPSFFIDDTEFIFEGQAVDSSPDFRGREYVEPTTAHIGKIEAFNDISDPLISYGYAQSDLEQISDPTSLSQEDINFRNTFNFYNTDGKKPPNIKKEEITSYIRIEFATPIGLDTVKDFPNGFVRDAGVEYFLPYIVNLTPGPFGRQSVKYNAAVIGMDPYGFDVAVKKIKDDLPTNRKLQGIDKGNYYKWWNHDTGSVLSKTEYLTTDYNGMDLWPEVGFETEFPYYAYDASQEDLHGGGYDMDFHMGGGYYFENESQNWMESLYHYGVSSSKQFDPLYRTSVVGSYVLPNSYRKLKPHRSWWSFFIPRNLFVPIRFANMFKTPNTKARDLFGGKGIFTISPNYWRTWYGSEFENWVSLSKDGVQELLDSAAPDLNFLVDGPDEYNGQTLRTHISAYSQDNEVTGYFRDSLMNYLAANYILYRPNLVTTDLWKYDLSGETEYGLVTPPADTEYEFFDRNFALQFIVHAKGSRTCKDIGLKCANPEAIKNGPVLASSGCTAAPYCSCPAQNLMPTDPEPTYLEIQRLYSEINECSLIASTLGEEWLGCEFSNPTSTNSCNCPNQGSKFKDYLAYTRTYATFWDCPLDLPLRRIAQMAQLQAQKIQIKIAPNENIQIGSLVEIINENDYPDQTLNKFKKISGKWMVSEIFHKMSETTYEMVVTLVRNGLRYDPNESKSPIAVLSPINTE